MSSAPVPPAPHDAEAIKKGKAMVKRYMTVFGLLFVGYGLASLAFPSLLGVIGLSDLEVGKILAGMFVFVGIVEIIVANRFLYEEDERK